MSVESKYYSILSLIFSKDLDYVLLRKNKGKLDGLIYPIHLKNEITDEVLLSKKIAEETGLKIQPGSWRIVTTLQNIEKIWRTDILMTSTDLTEEYNSCSLVSVKELPDICHPNLKWIVPLCLDVSVYGSIFNQILMK